MAKHSIVPTIATTAHTGKTCPILRNPTEKKTLQNDLKNDLKCTNLLLKETQLMVQKEDEMNSKVYSNYVLVSQNQPMEP
jgi:hypothetical protein